MTERALSSHYWMQDDQVFFMEVLKINSGHGRAKLARRACQSAHNSCVIPIGSMTWTPWLIIPGWNRARPVIEWQNSLPSPDFSLDVPRSHGEH